MNILHQLRSGGDDSFDDIQEMVPWLDQLMYPGQTWDDMLHRLKQEKGFSSELSFHVFKTHEHPPTLPVKDHIKYVVLIRNATDIFASIKPFFASFSDEYRGMWGGFPPLFANDDAFYDFWLKNAGGGVSGFKQFYVEFVKEWWPYRNQPNVFFLHYSDMRNDFPGSLDRLCDFLEVRLTKKEKARVAEYTSIDYMKLHMRKFESDANLKAAKELGYIAKNATTFATRGMVRKGGVGTGAKELPEDKVNELQVLYNELLGDTPDLAKWASVGGLISA